MWRERDGENKKPASPEGDAGFRVSSNRSQSRAGTGLPLEAETPLTARRSFKPPYASREVKREFHGYAGERTYMPAV
jgi:hypothetical protein